MQAGLDRLFPNEATIAHVHLTYALLENQINHMDEILSLQVSKGKDNLGTLILRKVTEEQQKYEQLLAESRHVAPLNDTGPSRLPEEEPAADSNRKQGISEKEMDEPRELEVAADAIDLMHDEPEIQPPPVGFTFVWFRIYKEIRH